MGDYEDDMAILRAYGLPEGGNAPQLEATNGANTIRLSSDPAESDVPPHVLEVADVDELKRIGGIPDAMYESGDIEDHLRVPSGGVAVRAASWTHRFAPGACAALTAYIYGNSAHVSDFRDHLNRVCFPMKVAVFSGDNLNLDAGQTLEVKSPDGNPVALVYQTVTAGPGAQIIWMTNGHMTADSMTFDQPSAADGLGDPQPTKFVSIGSPGTDGTNGASYSSRASDGSAGANGRDDGKSCGGQPTPGNPGTPGTAGGGGSGGADGGASSTVTWSVQALNGPVLVGSIGGHGGKGGDGGKGQDGGNGGGGGQPSSNCGNRPNGGDGGAGGQGGDGGPGGSGGAGGTLYITYKSGSPSFQVDSTGSTGGAGGVGGGGGAGGQGGNPSGKSGATGGTGSTKAAGASGKAGDIYINGKSA